MVQKNIVPFSGETGAPAQSVEADGMLRTCRHHTALMMSKESKAIIKRYNKIAQVFVEYEVVWDKAWRDLLDEARQGLNATLLCTHPETGKIEVNFDDSVFQLIR